MSFDITTNKCTQMGYISFPGALFVFHNSLGLINSDLKYTDKMNIGILLPPTATRPHGAVSQKALIFILAAVRT
jgi:hypothetical protein